MIVMEEILVANGITVLMMFFLLLCRRKNRAVPHAEDKLYDGMAIINLLGALSETVAFLVDGKVFAGGRVINYLSNSICFISTVSIGFVWCLYVELRIYRNYKRFSSRIRGVMIPWCIEVIAVLYNLFGTEFMFKISENNVYQRCGGSVLGYISLLLYFAYSIHLTYHSKNQGINLGFFPILYFITPCFIGVAAQFFFYGITTSWVFVSIALTFVQMQSYAENVYTDELTGLYNRRYYNAVFAARKKLNRGSLYGIMMDINDFKRINDKWGHSVGDRAICTVGDILLKSIPGRGIAIRYAGDEFIVLLSEVDAECALATVKEINDSLDKFNRCDAETFRLDVAIGYTDWRAEDNAETFLMRMDKEMYEEKRRYHAMQSSDQ